MPINRLSSCAVVLLLHCVGVNSLIFPSSTKSLLQQPTAFNGGKDNKMRQQQQQQFFSKHFDKDNIPGGSLLLTYLEINGFLLSTGGMTILIDPLLEGPLDFGIPSFYEGSKKVLPAQGLVELLPPLDCILLTQGLDDHTHVRTLTRIAELYTTTQQQGSSRPVIVAPPSSTKTLAKCGMTEDKYDIRVMESNDETTVLPLYQSAVSEPKSGVRIKATSGALVGPPWQKRENGYILRPDKSSSASPTAFPSLYIEPHVEFSRKQLKNEVGDIDIVITPTMGQSISKVFELVHGPNSSLRLIDILQPKVVIPMPNGNVDAKGAISPIVLPVGREDDFKNGLLALNNRQQRRGGRDGWIPKIVDLQAGADTVISCDGST